MIKKPDANEKKGLIEMNCRTFQDAVNEVFARKWEKRPGEQEEEEWKDVGTEV